MPVFTISEVNSMLNPFDNTTVAGDTIVNNTSGTLKLVQATEVTRGNVVSLEPDYTSLIEVRPGETSVALLDGDYFKLNEGRAMHSTIPSTVTVSA